MGKHNKKKKQVSELTSNFNEINKFINSHLKEDEMRLTAQSSNKIKLPYKMYCGINKNAKNKIAKQKSNDNSVNFPLIFH